MMAAHVKDTRPHDSIAILFSPLLAAGIQGEGFIQLLHLKDFLEAVEETRKLETENSKKKKEPTKQTERETERERERERARETDEIEI